MSQKGILIEIGSANLGLLMGVIVRHPTLCRHAAYHRGHGQVFLRPPREAGSRLTAWLLRLRYLVRDLDMIGVPVGMVAWKFQRGSGLGRLISCTHAAQANYAVLVKIEEGGHPSFVPEDFHDGATRMRPEGWLRVSFAEGQAHE